MSTPTVLIVEDDADLREALELTLAAHGIEVLSAASGPEALALLEKQAVMMVITDLKMAPMDGLALLAAIRQKLPHLPVAIMTAYGDVASAVAAMRAGACDFVLKPFEARDLLALIERYAHPGAVAGGVIAEDPQMRALLGLAERVAATDATVLISGESGVGKEVLARLIHQASPRRHAPFIAMNCAAIPETLLEATLFGYEKGAFTGASSAQPGKFEQAQQGTILLDEISEMPLALQAKLLRVLQEREVERLGGKKPVALDVRVLATTNRDLEAEVRAGRFREDLFYRLNVFPLAVPPLRARRGDIIPLAHHFLAEHARRWKKAAAGFTSEAEALLLSYDWPGNVRELSNVIQRALILAPGAVIDQATLKAALPALAAEDLSRAGSSLPSQMQAQPGVGSEIRSAELAHKAEPRSWRDQERERILQVLAEEKGSRRRAAERLGLPERTLRYRLQKYREAGYRIPGDEESS